MDYLEPGTSGGYRIATWGNGFIVTPIALLIQLFLVPHRGYEGFIDAAGLTIVILFPAATVAGIVVERRTKTSHRQGEMAYRLWLGNVAGILLIWMISCANALAR